MNYFIILQKNKLLVVISLPKLINCILPQEGIEILSREGGNIQWNANRWSFIFLLFLLLFFSKLIIIVVAWCYFSFLLLFFFRSFTQKATRTYWNINNGSNTIAALEEWKRWLVVKKDMDFIRTKHQRVATEVIDLTDDSQMFFSEFLWSLSFAHTFFF